MKQRRLLVVVITLLTVLSVFLISDKLSAPEDSGSSNFIAGQEVSLKGEMVCLPHRDQSGPQTMECAIGFKSESGDYFALKDTSPDYSLVSSAPMHESVIVTGIFTHSGDTKYQQSGLIEVTSISR